MKHASLVFCGIALLAACGHDPLAISDWQSRTVTLAVGQELDLTVGTVGPGAYKVPPAISSGALRFLDVKEVPPYEPAGPIQLFRFRGEAPGTAVIVIEHSGRNPTIQDTVVIR
jgi:hypothetical protein